MKHVRAAALSLAATLASAPALADEPSRFSISGFGTIGAVRTDNDTLGFRSSSLQDTGPGTSFDPSVDSVLGLQGSARILRDLDLTVQAVSRKGADDSYTPQVTWSFLRYKALPDLTLRVGRTRTPFFMFSDALNLNYITPWVRPPVEVYSLNPFSNVDGVDALYRIAAGPIDLEIQGLYGNSRLSIHDGSAKLRNIRSINFAASGHGLTLRASYMNAGVDILWGDAPARRLIDALVSTGYGNVADEMTGTGGKASFSSAGIQFDRNNWLLIGEYARREINRFTSSAHGWYLTTGYRIGNVTPYLTYARQMETSPATPSTVPIPPLAAGIELFNASRNNAQRSEGFGARWDIARNIAIKGQIEQVHPGPGGLGIFVSPSSRYLDPTSPIRVISLSVDFVF